MNEPIKFSELKKYNDSNSIVILSIIDLENSIDELNEFFHEGDAENYIPALMPKTLSVVEVHHLSDNVLGTEGRSDYLLVLDGTGAVNPMVHMMLVEGGMPIVWTSDFIDNFREDYKSGIRR